MLRRTVLAIPLALVLGCGAAPPAAAPVTTTAPPAEAAPGGAPASPAPAASLPPPARDGDAKKEGKAETPAPPGRAVATDAPLSTKITQDDILALVQKNSDSFYKCYPPGAGATKSSRPKVTVKATVSPTGAVNAVEVISSTTKNPKVDACVVGAFKKLTFTRAAGSGATVFTFPLSFDGMEQVQ